MAAMIVPVTIALAESENVPVEIRIVGTVEPSSRVEIKSMVAGQITNVGFTEGADVKQDDLLFEIDQRPYQEALRQAEAAVERELTAEDFVFAEDEKEDADGDAQEG